MGQVQVCLCCTFALAYCRPCILLDAHAHLQTTPLAMCEKLANGMCDWQCLTKHQSNGIVCVKWCHQEHLVGAEPRDSSGAAPPANNPRTQATKSVLPPSLYWYWGLCDSSLALA